MRITAIVLACLAYPGSASDAQNCAKKEYFIIKKTGWCSGRLLFDNCAKRPCKPMTQEQCEAKCSSDSRCKFMVWGATYRKWAQCKATGLCSRCGTFQTCSPQGYADGKPDIYYMSQSGYVLRNLVAGSQGNNVNPGGGLITGFSLGQCIDACDKNPRCKSVSYSSLVKHCSLLDRCVNYADKGVGHKTSWRTVYKPCLNGYFERDQITGQAPAAHLGDVIPHVTAPACAQACDKNSQCKSFTYTIGIGAAVPQWGAGCRLLSVCVNADTPCSSTHNNKVTWKAYYKPCEVPTLAPTPAPTLKLPLYNWWNSKKTDNFATIGDWPKSQSYVKRDGANGAASGFIGYVYSTQEPGTLPLYNWYRAAMTDNFATIGDWPASQDYVKAGGANGTGTGLIGYIYSTQQPGTLPLYNWFSDNPFITDLFATVGNWPTSDEYAKGGGANNAKSGLIGYILTAEAFACTTGPGAACKTCLPFQERTVTNHCETCNPGYWNPGRNGSCEAKALCKSSKLTCDAGYVLKSADNAYCAGAACLASDKSACCEAKGLCIDASSTIICDDGYFLKSACNAYCAGAVCQASDKSACCEAFSCITGAGAACKTCKSPEQRTANDQCATCNLGYFLNGESICIAVARVPLYNWWNKALSDNFAAVGDWPASSGYTKGGGANDAKSGLIGYIYPFQQPGTLPLYNWYRAAVTDNFATIGDWPASQDYVKLGGDAIGYIYSTQQPGTLPLYNWFSENPFITDLFATVGDWPTSDEYAKIAGANNAKSGLIGYILTAEAFAPIPDLYTIDPSNGSCPDGEALTEKECASLDGQIVGGQVVVYEGEIDWPAPESCQCYFNQRETNKDSSKAEVYFNLCTNGPQKADPGEISICHRKAPAPTAAPTPTSCGVATPYCLKITTFSSYEAEGNLDVSVDSGGGLKQEASGHYEKAAVVLQKCYANPVKTVQLFDPTTDGWTGSMLYSQDGGKSYSGLTCVSHCSGPFRSSSDLEVDGDVDGAGFAPTECLNGQKCLFKPTPACEKGFLHTTATQTYCANLGLKDITSEAECKKAAQALGLKWGRAWNGPGDFQKCLLSEKARNAVYYNLSPSPQTDPTKLHGGMLQYTAICECSEATPPAPRRAAWKLIGAGKGCSNWQDISIDQPRYSMSSVEDCGSLCASTSGCVGFAYAPRSHCPQGGEQLMCYLWNGDCVQHVNHCWDEYVMTETAEWGVPQVHSWKVGDEARISQYTLQVASAIPGLKSHTMLMLALAAGAVWAARASGVFRRMGTSASHDYTALLD